ncbi:MAG TPA: enoyl-CoA hydratase/isomerase family protein [Solirubrobacteraceae bacterium]|nr:enoyl-CoA hydratase/isomerase family protein [Solirubrobacteraceae bacterium]
MRFADARSDVLLFEQDGPVAIITFNRPAVMNTISDELEDELHAALDRAVADDSVRVIVLTGAGEKAFSAGYEMGGGDGEPPETTGEIIRHWWDTDTKTPAKHWHLLTLDKPVVAAVHGWTLAGAFWYTLAADITIAADDAVFGQPEIRETQNSTALLPFLIGWKHTARYALTGDHFDAQEALRIGVVNEVVPRAELMDHVMTLAKRIAMVPADSLRLNKRITAFALEAMGMRTALEGAGFLSTIVHSSAKDSPELQEMFQVRETEGMGASLKVRDGKFRPEPGGPRSVSR